MQTIRQSSRAPLSGSRRLAQAIPLGLLLAGALSSFARPPLYEQAGQATQVSASYVENSASDFDPPVAGETGGQRTDINGLWDPGEPGGFAIGYSHQYDSLDIDLEGDETLSNGHHHTIALPLHWHREISGGDMMTLSLAPAISVSSNVLKDPGLVDNGAVQLWGSALYRIGEGSLDWLLGINHDYRFGDSKVYPVAGGEWANETTTVRLTYPDIMANWRPAERWSFEASVSPDGNLWRVWDRDKIIDSDFRREAWRAELRLLYRLPRGWRIGFTAGHTWDTAWKFKASTPGVVRSDGENQSFIGAYVGWLPVTRSR